MKKLEAYSGHAYAALRVVAGLTFACFGAQKLFGWFHAPFMPPVGSQIWIGAVIELVGGLMIAAGLKTRWAAFICSGEMAVAYIQFHWKLALGWGFFPIVNQGGPALLYCFMFLYMATRGSGRLAAVQPD